MINPDVLAKADTTPWFSTVGEPLPSAVRTIRSWSEWPGPESELVAPIHYRQQERCDAFRFSESEYAWWHELLEALVDCIKPNVPFVENADSWSAPNAAVWHGAWTLALDAVYSDRDKTIPAELEAQMYWFSEGRWPCSLVALNSGNSPNGYIVF